MACIVCGARMNGDETCAGCGAPRNVREAFLEVASGPLDGETLCLRPERRVIGRAAGKTALTLADPAVSACHARVWLADDEAFVEDAGSTHGTALNGTPLTAPAALCHG